MSPRILIATNLIFSQSGFRFKQSAAKVRYVEETRCSRFGLQVCHAVFIKFTKKNAMRTTLTPPPPPLQYGYYKLNIVKQTKKFQY